ncbi:APC family permease [Spiroplasma taiwanense]|uniref:Amino acid permease family protein n=1 Tax=Spiroplasma taiwanense CT-1 TaxID=1276220 RepID=S5LTN5_9MOLU|nr:amino acid permease [Spiroplasma taiwanense]AGR41074.1 amino acid permease family protein [Spiroplasma taiwanense CT-1]
MSSRVKSLTKFTIIFMSFVTIFGFRNIVNNQNQFGLLACILFLIGGAIYALPMVFISSELGSVKKLKDQEAGLGSFCVFTLGQKNGFIAAWASYFGNLFFFATLAPFTVIALSFFFYGANGFDKMAEIFSEQGLSENNATRASACILSLCAILIFWGASFVSKKGPKWIGKLTTIGGAASLILGLGFIVIALVFTLPVLGVQSDFNSQQLDPLNDPSMFDGDWWSFISAVPWLIFAYVGIETMCVFIKDTKGGAKTFKVATFIGMIIVIALMVLGSLLLSLTISQNAINKWGISNAYYLVFPKLMGLEIDSTAGKVIIHIVGLVTAFNGLGSLFFWIAGPSKVFFSEIPPKAMGKWIAKTDNNGMPVNALFIQAVIVSIILMIVGATTTGTLGQGSSVFLEKIMQATTSTAIIQMLYLFVGYIKMRIKDNDVERDYIWLKNHRNIVIAISSVTVILLGVAFIFGTIPSPEKWKTDWLNALIDFLFIFGGFIFFMAFGYIIWWINIERPLKKINKSENLEVKTKKVVKENE